MSIHAQLFDCFIDDFRCWDMVPVTQGTWARHEDGLALSVGEVYVVCTSTLHSLKDTPIAPSLCFECEENVDKWIRMIPGPDHVVQDDERKRGSGALA